MPNLSFKHYKFISNTPALPLALNCWHELSQKNFCGSEVLIAWDNRSIVAFSENDEPVAVITFIHQDYLYQFHILLGYVVQRHRSTGVYQALWNELLTLARAENIKIISSATNPKNESMRKISEKFDRKISSINYKFDFQGG